MNTKVSLDTATLAAAGSTQTDAALLIAGNTFVTGADDTKGVVLPMAVIGMKVVVINTTPNKTLKVYPNTNQSIQEGLNEH